jgi:His-Xaa-Ser system radical SAM maturase HxsC
MIKLSGTPQNIDEPILGKISFSSVSQENRSNIIYVNPVLPIFKLKNYLGVISSFKDISEIEIGGVPIIYDVLGIDSLKNGDVVEIFPNGVINVLYQSASKDNILFLTSRCNQNCLICPQIPENEERDLFNNNIKLIQLIDKATEEIAITGGEPTMVGDDLFRIILACKHFLPETSLLLLTNGTNFNDYQYAHFFSSIKHSRLTIAVSMHNDNPFDHDLIVGLKGAFNQTIKGIINLGSFGNSIEIRTVINRYNYQRLSKIADYIYRNLTFVEHIAFMGLETVGNALKNLNSLWIEPKDICSPLEEAVHYLVQRDMKVSIYNIPLCLLPEKLWKYARKSISEWKNAFHPKCEVCNLKKTCPGLFESGVNIYANYLKTF